MMWHLITLVGATRKPSMRSPTLMARRGKYLKIYTMPANFGRSLTGPGLSSESATELANHRWVKTCPHQKSNLILAGLRGPTT